MADIINIQNFAPDALRNTGYKDIVSAMAEIVDNSLEANAQDVLIICTLKKNRHGREVVTDIAFLDNGGGMDDEQANKCLSVGESSRRSRRGMGRFGVGLPQASLHACPYVEVYTWQQPHKIKKVSLDIKKISTGQQETIELHHTENVPQEFKKYINNFNFKVNRSNINMDFSQHGTLVVWRNCDRVKPKQFNTLRDHCQEEMGRKFRHFISADQHLITSQHKIALVAINGESEHFNPVDANNTLLKPNDPLYLMKDNMCLGDRANPNEPTEQGEPLFELWNDEKEGHIGCKEFTIPCQGKNEGREGVATVRFSMSKDEFRHAGGSSGIGKKTVKNVGISVLRAGREIDFGGFGFFDVTNAPQHRWWGCEIQFNPDLDEVFGLSNNKQQVEFLKSLLKKMLLPGENKNMISNIEEYCQDEDICYQFAQMHIFIKQLIAKMYQYGKKVKKGSRTQKRMVNRAEEIVVQNIEQSNKKQTNSGEFLKQHPNEAFEHAKRHIIKDGTPDPSQSEVKKVQELPVKISLQALGERRPFIEVDKKAGNTWLIINQDSLFYAEVYAPIEDLGSQGEIILQALNLSLMALARAEDEASVFNDQLHEAFCDIREAWSKKMRTYLKADYKA